MMEGDIMEYMDLVRYRKNEWIFMYIEKYDEDDRAVRYRYLIDTDDMDKAGKIEINKDVKFVLTDQLYKKMNLIEDYFEKGMIKIICCPLNIADKTEKIEDYNAVYVARTIIEYHYWTGVYDDHFTRIATDHFETYVKKYTELFELTDDDSNILDFIQYEKEFLIDNWLYIKIEKIFEDQDILRYKFFVDTLDENDYSIMEFSKEIKIKIFRKYIPLFERLKHKGLLKTDKHIDTHTADDIIYNRRSVIAMKYILDHKNENEYISQAVIINEDVYDYYNQVTEAINHLELKNEDSINKND